MAQCASPPFTFASGTSARISKIEIIGSTRMNRKNSITNSPMVPKNVIQSHRVGQYIPQDDGRKSRCRLVTTMTKRSSHMPTLTTMATAKRPSVLVRTRRNHSHCGVMMLQKMSVQYMYQYGPVIRFQIMKPSYLLVLYQPKKASEM